MTDEKTQTENIQEPSKEELALPNNKEVVEEKPRLEDDKIYDLNDNREYPNQRDLLNNIAQLYAALTPSYKKLVRLSIARHSKE